MVDIPKAITTVYKKIEAVASPATNATTNFLSNFGKDVSNRAASKPLNSHHQIVNPIAGHSQVEGFRSLEAAVRNKAQPVINAVKNKLNGR